MHADEPDKSTNLKFNLKICVFSLGLVAVFAQESPAPPDSWQSRAADSSPIVDRERGPAWTWGIELRGRLELPTAIDFNDYDDDQFGLIRMRLWSGWEASEQLRFYVQLQDARAPGFSDPNNQDAAVHHVDFREAYADFGREQGAWSLRAGRQELAFGDERLVGADNYWDPLGQVFDALRLSYHRTGLRVDAFGAFVVIPTSSSFTTPSIGNRLYGLYTSLDKLVPGSAIEPYFFWKNDRGVGEGQEADAGNDVFTYGVRAAGKLPYRLDYNVEMARQSGHRVLDAVHAWAGHWELGFRVRDTELGPRLGAEYNFATGDSRSGDGRHTTFDDLYPAGYNKYGMADPFAWRNIENVSGSLDWGISRRWRMGVGYRSFWLASIQDGLYTKGDLFLTLNPYATSRHVGNQASIMAAYEFSKSLQLYGGYARFFPGQYLVDCSHYGSFSSPYVMLNYKFN